MLVRELAGFALFPSLECDQMALGYVPPTAGLGNGTCWPLPICRKDCKITGEDKLMVVSEYGVRGKMEISFQITQRDSYGLGKYCCSLQYWSLKPEKQTYARLVCCTGVCMLQNIVGLVFWQDTSWEWSDRACSPSAKEYPGGVMIPKTILRQLKMKCDIRSLLWFGNRDFVLCFSL